MESLPQKNVRRSDRRIGGLQSYFNSDALIEKTMRIYGDDVRLFYNDVSVDHLIQNAPLPAINTLHSKGLKLSNWLPAAPTAPASEPERIPNITRTWLPTQIKRSDPTTGPAAAGAGAGGSW